LNDACGWYFRIWKFWFKTNLRKILLLKLLQRWRFRRHKIMIRLINLVFRSKNYIPPKKGRSHVLRIIRELIEFQPQSKKNRFRTSLEVLSSNKKRKRLFYNLWFYVCRLWAFTE
jgi:hypothetical protein